MGAIKEQGNTWVFDLNDFESHEHDRRQMDTGVNVFTRGKWEMVGAIVFDKKQFADLTAVRKWLTARGFTVSDGAQANFEASKPGTKLYYPRIARQFAQQDFQEAEMTFIHYIPMTPGVHNEFSFTEQVLERDLLPILQERPIPLLEHHTFEDPGDVAGSTIPQATTYDNKTIKGVALVNKPESVKKIHDGEFDSVSVSVFLEADDDLNVLRITDMEELTLTDIPADPDAVILAHEDVMMPIPFEGANEGNNEQPLIVVALDGQQMPTVPQFVAQSQSPNSTGDEMSEETQENPEQPPVVVPPPVVPAAMEAVPPSNPQQMVNLENQVTSLQKEQNRLRLENAKLAAHRLVLEKKIKPAQEELAAQLQATLSPAQAELWDKFMSHNSAPAIGGGENVTRQDVGMNAQGPLVLEDYQDVEVLLALDHSQIRQMLYEGRLNRDQALWLEMTKLNREWQVNGGDGAAAQQAQLEAMYSNQQAHFPFAITPKGGQQ